MLLGLDLSFLKNGLTGLSALKKEQAYKIVRSKIELQYPSTPKIHRDAILNIIFDLSSENCKENLSIDDIVGRLKKLLPPSGDCFNL